MSDPLSCDVSLTGACLCGAVHYTIRPPLRPVRVCHCRQCQKWSGHSVAATSALTQNLAISGEDSLRWYPSSEFAERGFCAKCGSGLFWRAGPDQVSVMAGSLDPPTGLAVEMHIYCADAPDYAAVQDDAPRYPQDAPSRWDPLART